MKAGNKRQALKSIKTASKSETVLSSLLSGIKDLAERIIPSGKEKAVVLIPVEKARDFSRGHRKNIVGQDN